MGFLNDLWAKIADGAGSGAPRILVVDDDPDIRGLVKDILETQNYAVDVVVDGFQALARYKKGAYALMIIDRRMPRMDGNELLEAIRSRPGGKEQRVIMLSAENMLGPIDKAYALGISDWIAKPFTASALLTKVDAQLKAAKK